MHRTVSHRAGFTLIELMVAVAIIGILASIAIPAFQTYRIRSMRAEAMGNLRAISEVQAAYFAEYATYVGAIAMPGPAPSSNQRPWQDTLGDYDRMGFRPEGGVRFDYEVHTAATGCACASCFTVTAYGDLESDGSYSMLQYVQPNAAETQWCTSMLFPGWGVPLRNGSELFNEVGWNGAADDY